MPAMLNDGGLEYDDGTPATQTQQARDVVTFLAWAAEPGAPLLVVVVVVVVVECSC